MNLKFNLCLVALLMLTVSKNIQSLDPFVDFQVPRSLTEMLHAQLISLQDVVHSMTGQAQDILGNKMVQMNALIVDMSSSFDPMIDSSKLHTVYRVDTQFLQSLIDRINSMIEQLEQNDGVPAESKAQLEEGKIALEQLRINLSAHQIG